MSERKWDRRDRKRRSKEKNARMRGKRSVFEIGKAIAKRAKQGRKHGTPSDTENQR